MEKSCKAVVYQKNATDEYVVLFLRGDLEANETKLTNFLGEAIHPAVITPESVFAAGYIGPLGLPAGVTALFDVSLAGTNNLCCGANREEYHYTGFCFERDLPGVAFHDFSKVKQGGICRNAGNMRSAFRAVSKSETFSSLARNIPNPWGCSILIRMGSCNIPSWDAMATV